LYIARAKFLLKAQSTSKSTTATTTPAAAEQKQQSANVATTETPKQTISAESKVSFDVIYIYFDCLFKKMDIIIVLFFSYCSIFISYIIATIKTGSRTCRIVQKSWQ
jgi:hypothetical protein